MNDICIKLLFCPFQSMFSLRRFRELFGNSREWKFVPSTLFNLSEFFWLKFYHNNFLDMFYYRKGLFHVQIKLIGYDLFMTTRKKGLMRVSQEFKSSPSSSRKLYFWNHKYYPTQLFSQLFDNYKKLRQIFNSLAITVSCTLKILKDLLSLEKWF